MNLSLSKHGADSRLKRSRWEYWVVRPPVRNQTGRLLPHMLFERLAPQKTRMAHSFYSKSSFRRFWKKLNELFDDGDSRPARSGSKRRRRLVALRRRERDRKGWPQPHLFRSRWYY